MITVNGRPDAVLLDAEVFERKLKALNLQKLSSEAEEDVKAVLIFARVLTADEVARLSGACVSVEARCRSASAGNVLPDGRNWLAHGEFARCPQFTSTVLTG